MHDPKRLVRDGYDAIAKRYLDWSGFDPSAVRMAFLERILRVLAPGSDVLELGCGAGVPVTRALAGSHHVTGVDISAAQLALAREYVPTATLIHADMTQLDLAPHSFDAVVSFYAFTHVPRDEHLGLLRAVHGWLRPGGRLFATMGAGDDPGGVEEDWLGAPMYFSHFDADTNRGLVRQAGFELEAADVVDEDEDGKTVSFLWVMGRVGRGP